MRNLHIILVYLVIMGIGIGAPFVMTLGYVWVDIFRPQDVTWAVLDGLPLAMIMGAGAVAAYLIWDRQAPPRFSALTAATIAFFVWATLSCFWAEVPDRAWWKWDWAAKGILFSAFYPLVIRPRTQVEAFIQVLVFSLAAHFIPFGAKSIISGGGYGVDLGLLAKQDSFLSEGATLSAVCTMAIPLLLFLYKHSRIVPLNWLTKLGYLGLGILAFATAVGTYERTALLGLVALVCMLWWGSRRKVLFGLFLAIGAGVGINQATDTQWGDRMATIATYEDDSSAYTRILVWRWTLDYVSRNPLGGGFEVYRTNTITSPPDEQGNVRVQNGRAFHSIYFEVLGELGWVGLALFLSLMGLSLRYLNQVRRGTRKQPHLLWLYDLAGAIRNSLLVMMFCGLTIGIAFQPFLYYLFALSFCTLELYRRTTAQDRVPALAGSVSGPLAVAER